MLGFMLEALRDTQNVHWQIRTAGTLASEGRAMSVRTRNALAGIAELSGRRFNDHRSHRLDDEDAEWADVILATEASQVTFVRARFPQATAKAVLLGQFLRSAPSGMDLRDQVRSVALESADPGFDVADPAGGDQTVYDNCADQLWEMSRTLVGLIGE
jgi:protein-tyrosine-phosphatase